MPRTSSCNQGILIHVKWLLPLTSERGRTPDVPAAPDLPTKGRKQSALAEQKFGIELFPRLAPYARMTCFVLRAKSTTTQRHASKDSLPRPRHAATTRQRILEIREVFLFAILNRTQGSEARNDSSSLAFEHRRCVSRGLYVALGHKSGKPRDLQSLDLNSK